MSKRFYRIATICDDWDVSRTWVWRKIQDGTLPKPIRLSPNVVGWRAETIDAWLAERETEGE